MRKKKIIKNVPVVCLALTNIALATEYGFNRLSVLSLVLAGVVLLWDIMEVVTDGNKGH